jgi:hypothetical protein
MCCPWKTALACFSTQYSDSNYYAPRSKQTQPYDSVNYNWINKIKALKSAILDINTGQLWSRYSNNIILLWLHTSRQSRGLRSVCTQRHNLLATIGDFLETSGGSTSCGCACLTIQADQSYTTGHLALPAVHLEVFSRNARNEHVSFSSIISEHHLSLVPE